MLTHPAPHPPAAPPSHPRKTRALLLLLCAALAVATFATFWGLRSGEFLNCDDDRCVTENPQVREGWTWTGLAWASRTFCLGNYIPVTWLSHMTDVQLFGLDPGKHHTTNLVLHAIDGILLLLLLHRMTGAVWRSAFVAALFALHPLHVESVAWIAERKDVLSTLFWLLTLAAWLAFTRSRRPGWYLLALVLCALGLAAKPMLVTLPFTLLLLDYWPLARLRWPPWKQPGAVGALLLEKVPLFALAAASSIVTVVAQSRAEAVSTLAQVSLPSRLANACVAYASYLERTFWPHSLAVFYPYPLSGYPLWQPLLALAVLAGVTLLLLSRARRAPYALSGWLWYLGTLVPVIGLVQVGSQAMADRYTYVPLIGIFVALAWGLHDLAQPHPRLRIAAIGACVLALVAFAAASKIQSGYWRNNFTLYEHALEAAPENWWTHYNLGLALARSDAPGRALPHLERALELRPGFARAHNNLAGILAGMGRMDEAISHCSRAVELDPANAEARFNLAAMLRRMGRNDEAAAQLTEVLRLKPEDTQSREMLAETLLQSGRLDASREQFEEVLRRSPNSPAALDGLGLILANRGLLSEAEKSYRLALEFHPTSAEIHNNLGVALARQGRMREAAAQFEEALRLKPDFGEAAANLQRASR